jgi:hypothetical protein
MRFISPWVSYAAEFICCSDAISKRRSRKGGVLLSRVPVQTGKSGDDARQPALPDQLPHRPVEAVERQGIHPAAQELAHHSD